MHLSIKYLILIQFSKLLKVTKKRKFLSVFRKRLKMDVALFNLETLNVILQNKELSQMDRFSFI